LKQLGWDEDLTAEELAVINKIGGGNPDKVNWKIDMSGGIQRVAIKHGAAPFGNAKPRAEVWTYPDPIPIHREPLYTPRRDLLDKYRTYDDWKSFYRLPVRYWSIQQKDFSKKYPLILTSGRLVEYEGGGDGTRANPWLAELQQVMFVEINPEDAINRNIRDGQQVWVEGAEGARLKVMAMVTRRVAPGVAFLTFNFSAQLERKNLLDKFPEGAEPYVLGEAANTALTYGYDSVTQMQETKVSLCQIETA
jgi:formate dehydrogenase major subunit